MQRIIPHMWFDNQAEEAARFYVAVFRNSRMGGITRYGGEGAKVSGRPKGSVMTVSFSLDGQEFMALNGGPAFKFSEAVSFIVNCDGQDEVDYYWEKLTEGGDEKAQVCGWLKDKFGLSWQVVPSVLGDMMRDKDAGRSERVMKAMLQMRKLDVNALRRAYGEG